MTNDECSGSIRQCQAVELRQSQPMIMKIEHDQRRFQTDRPRQDPPEPAEVHHARRDDRPQGSRSGQHSAAAARRAAFPLRQERLRRRRAGRRRRRPADRPAAAMPKDGKGQAGSDPGAAHLLEVESRSKNWPRSWATSWNCRASSPRARPPSRRKRSAIHSIRHTGPESLRHFKRTYMKALRRQISTGAYEPRRPADRSDPATTSAIAPGTRVEQPEANAVVIYMMDVSGSMTDEQKEIVRTEAFWIDTWLSQPVRRHRDALHHSRRGRPRKSTRTRSITPAKAAARGSARPTRRAPS